jgi:hypothetical protein
MRVKGFVSLLTALLITSVLPQVAHAADLPSFEIKSVSSTMIDPGDTVTWKIQVNLIPGWVKDLNVALRTPAGEIRNISVLVEPTYKVSAASSKEISLSLKTNDFDLPGKYKLLYGSLYNEKEFFAYDPINAKEYASKGYMVSQNLSQFDFTIRDSGSEVKKTPQFIESITFSKSQVDPGSSSKLQIQTSGTGSLVSVNVQLSTPDGISSAYCDATSTGNSYSCQDLTSNSGKYSFAIPVWTATDNTPGNYRVTQINMGYRNGDATSGSNDTASWGGNIVYEDSENIYNGVKSQKLSQFSQSGLSFTLLDAGQGIAQAPIWNELQWKTKSVKAGSIATLVISAEGFTRNIGNISIPFLVPQGDKVESLSYYDGSNQVVRLIKPVQEKSMSAIVKSGTYEVEVYIPRKAKPGNYVIGQLSLLSTSCQLANMQAINENNKVNNISCQGWPNAWHTTYYLGSVTKDFGAAGYNIKPWANYKDPLMLPIEVTAPAPLEAPKLEEVKRTPTSLEFRYLYSNEQSCKAKSSAGDLIDEKGVKDIYVPLIVNNLKPDSEVTLTLSCSDATGATAESMATSRTLKPIPPASPKLTLETVTTNSAIFSIGIREDFKYSVKVESGAAQILGNKESGYKVEVTGLKPGVKTNLVATITDSYGQSTSTEPFYFAAELPPRPTKPLLIVGKLSNTRVEFSYEKLANLDYELSVSEGEVSDIRGSVRVSGLTPNTKITVSLKATDEFGQSAISDELIIKSAVPELPAISTLYLVKTSSDSITLRFTPRTGMKYLAKVSSGSATITEGLLVLSALKPDSTVDVTFIMSDSFGQNKYSLTSYTTAPAPAPQKATKTSITCIKGKASIIITAVKPKCPSGYRKK